MKIQKHKIPSYRSYLHYRYSARHIIRAAWNIVKLDCDIIVSAAYVSELVKRSSFQEFDYVQGTGIKSEKNNQMYS